MELQGNNKTGWSDGDEIWDSATEDDRFIPQISNKTSDEGTNDLSKQVTKSKENNGSAYYGATFPDPFYERAFLNDRIAEGHSVPSKDQSRLLYKLSYDNNVEEIVVHEADSGSEAGHEDVETFGHQYETNHEPHTYVNKLCLAAELLQSNDFNAEVVQTEPLPRDLEPEDEPFDDPPPATNRPHLSHRRRALMNPCYCCNVM